jgi:hypothetical protein
MVREAAMAFSATLPTLLRCLKIAKLSETFIASPAPHQGCTSHEFYNLNASRRRCGAFGIPLCYDLGPIRAQHYDTTHA